MEAVVDECGDGLVEAHYNVVKVLLSLYRDEWCFFRESPDREDAILAYRRKLCTEVVPLFLQRAKCWHEEAKISPFQRDLYEQRSQRLFEIGNHLLNYDYQTKVLHLAEAFF